MADQRKYEHKVMGVVFALAAFAGCGHPDGPRTDDVVPIVSPGGNGGSIVATDVDGVWIFRMSGGWGEQALFIGEARIEGDCLVVGESVVIWSAGQASLAVELIAEVRSGAAPVVRLVGGESSDVPAMIADRCPVEGVWRTSSYEAAR